MQISVSTCTNPWINLAFEAYLLQQPNLTPHLFFWHSTPAVVIGRNQNPWKESDLLYLHRKHILLVRRESGGGAVYHDRGNLNFSLILPREIHNPHSNLIFIVRALHRIGIPATQNDRHDIIVHGKKVSGSAFRIKQTHVLHHGTLLISANLHKLRKSINDVGMVKAGNFVQSVRSSVANLTQFDRTIKRTHVIHACVAELSQTQYPFNTHTSNIAVQYLNTKTLTQHARVIDAVHYLQDWRWIYGKTAACTLSLSFRIKDDIQYLFIEIENAIIQTVTIRSNNQKRDSIGDALNNRFKQMPLNDDLITAIHRFKYDLRNTIAIHGKFKRSIVKTLLFVWRTAQARTKHGTH